LGLANRAGERALIAFSDCWLENSYFQKLSHSTIILTISGRVTGQFVPFLERRWSPDLPEIVGVTEQEASVVIGRRYGGGVYIVMKKLCARTRAFVLLSGGIGAMSVAIASPVYAQSTPAPAEDGGAIVVTGVRASVASALDLQKNATSLQQSIVAEDIGKLPSNNVVEALQNVTGVSIVRNSAEPGTVLIRGLPDIATTLSGRTIFTSSSRSISLPDFPAELLSRVDVKKAPEASDIEGGIAGVINVELRRPFDFPGFQLAGSIKASRGSLDRNVWPQGSFLISNTWETGNRP
jgi:hypothetical protein